MMPYETGIVCIFQKQDPTRAFVLIFSYDDYMITRTNIEGKQNQAILTRKKKKPNKQMKKTQTTPQNTTHTHNPPHTPQNKTHP